MNKGFPRIKLWKPVYAARAQSYPESYIGGAVVLPHVWYTSFVCFFGSFLCTIKNLFSSQTAIATAFVRFVEKILLTRALCTGYHDFTLSAATPKGDTAMKEQNTQDRVKILKAIHQKLLAQRSAEIHRGEKK
jgi:hypothetical protein